MDSCRVCVSSLRYVPTKSMSVRERSQCIGRYSRRSYTVLPIDLLLRNLCIHCPTILVSCCKEEDCSRIHWTVFVFVVFDPKWRFPFWQKGVSLHFVFWSSTMDWHFRLRPGNCYFDRQLHSVAKLEPPSTLVSSAYTEVHSTHYLTCLSVVILPCRKLLRRLQPSHRQQKMCQSHPSWQYCGDLQGRIPLSDRRLRSQLFTFLRLHPTPPPFRCGHS